MSEEQYRGLKLGDPAVRMNKQVMFLGHIVGAFITSKQEQYLIMETYSGCIHYGPADEFYPDKDQDSLRLAAKMVIRDRSDEPTEKVLPPLATSKW